KMLTHPHKPGNLPQAIPPAPITKHPRPHRPRRSEPMLPRTPHHAPNRRKPPHQAKDEKHPRKDPLATSSLRPRKENKQNRCKHPLSKTTKNSNHEVIS